MLLLLLLLLLLSSSLFCNSAHPRDFLSSAHQADGQTWLRCSSALINVAQITSGLKNQARSDKGAYPITQSIWVISITVGQTKNTPLPGPEQTWRRA